MLALQEPRNPRALRDLGTSLDNLGEVERQCGDARDAFSALDEGLAIWRRLADLSPDTATWKNVVLIRLTSLASLSLTRGDRDRTLAMLHDALSIAETLVALDPADPRGRDDLAAVRAAMGSLTR